MAEYFNLKGKFNMILHNQGRLVLSDQSITSPQNEPERSPGFVSPQNATTNSSGEFGLEETSPDYQDQIVILHLILVTTRQILVFPYSAHQRSLTGKHFSLNYGSFLPFAVKNIPTTNRETLKLMLGTN